MGDARPAAHLRAAGAPDPGQLRSGAAPPTSYLRAGVSRVDITDYDAGPVNDPLFVKALVLGSAATTVAVITVDAVAIAEIGSITAPYLDTVREQLQAAVGLDPAAVLVNASHCHGKVCADVAARTVLAVRQAWADMEPVTVGAGSGREERVAENRRMRLRGGREADVRQAYPLPPDDEVMSVGPVDPEIGVLRLDRLDGTPLAVVYHFACHPIQGVPGGGNTADIVGFASRTIETALGGGATALFLQGCAGDINPAGYKDADYPRNAEHLGNMLGLSALAAVHQIQTGPDLRLQLLRQVLPLPLEDLAASIDALRAEQEQLVASLRGTTLDLKAFVPLLVRYGLSPGYPSAPAHRYLHQRATGAAALDHLDAHNRAQLDIYVANIRTMEALIRLRENLALLEKHQAAYARATVPSVDAEVLGLRVGDFVLVGFAGELSVEIGLELKRLSPHPLTYVSGCTNGYLYYAPTSAQLANRGWAQEDTDCRLAPAWQPLFTACAAELLRQL